MPSPLTHWGIVLKTYFQHGHEGLADIQNRLESEAHEQPGGKFSKKQVMYLPQGPIPPTVWRTSCGRCRFWEEGGPGEPGRCHIVGREDDSFGGEDIHYRGWCAFWMPPEGEPAFAWINQRLRPDGKTSVRGEYNPELTEKERRRTAQAEGPTEPDVRRAAIQGEERDVDGE